jgi:hypothetical protein
MLGSCLSEVTPAPFHISAISFSNPNIDLIESKLRTAGWKVLGSMSWEKKVSFSLKIQTNSGVYPAWCSMDRGVLPGINGQGRAVNHSPPSSEEVMNWWSCTSTLTICFCGAYRENFVFLSFFLVFLSFFLCLFGPFLCFSHNSSLYLPFYLFFVFPHLSLNCCFCWTFPLVIFLFSPFCLQFVAFYESSFHLTTSQSVILLNGKKHSKEFMTPAVV